MSPHARGKVFGGWVGHQCKGKHAECSPRSEADYNRYQYHRADHTGTTVRLLSAPPRPLLFSNR